VKKFNAKRWLEGEIQDQMDLYGNTREYAIEFVKELLETDEYRDELTDQQVRVVFFILITKEQKS